MLQNLVIKAHDTVIGAIETILSEEYILHQIWVVMVIQLTLARLSLIRF